MKLHYIFSFYMSISKVQMSTIVDNNMIAPSYFKGEVQ